MRPGMYDCLFFDKNDRKSNKEGGANVLVEVKPYIHGKTSHVCMYGHINTSTKAELQSAHLITGSRYAVDL